MSLVAAVHNGTDIVIGWDSRSRYEWNGRSVVPPSPAEKVVRIHDGLALMVTGSYNSDKLPLFEDFTRDHVCSSLDQAWGDLYSLGDKLVLQAGEEGLMIGLAGYIAGQPTYRFVQGIYSDPDMGFILDYPRNYYLSGMEHPTATAASLIVSRGLSMRTATANIEEALRTIVSVCIEQYPSQLGGTAEIMTLTNP